MVSPILPPPTMRMSFTSLSPPENQQGLPGCNAGGWELEGGGVGGGGVGWLWMGGRIRQNVEKTGRDSVGSKGDETAAAARNPLLDQIACRRLSLIS